MRQPDGSVVHAPKPTSPALEKLMRDVLGHVLEGDPAANPVQPGSTLAEGLGLTITQYSRAWVTVFELFGGVPAEPAYRFAGVLEAATPSYSMWRSPLALPGGAQWPEQILLLHRGVTESPPARPASPDVPLTMRQLEAMQVVAGWAPATLLVAALVCGGDRWHRPGDLLVRLPDVPEALARHVDAVREAFPVPLPAHGSALELLERADDATLAALAPQLARASMVGGRELRARAGALLRRTGAAAESPLREIATDGKPDERAAALRRLHAHAAEAGDAELHDWVRATAAADRAGSVRALPSDWDRVGEAVGVADLPYVYDVPAVQWACPVTPAVERAVRAQWELFRRYSRVGSGSSGHQPRIPDCNAVLAYLASPSPMPPESARLDQPSFFVAREFVTAGPDLPPPAAVKVLAALRLIDPNAHGNALFEALRGLRARAGGPGLLQVAELLRPFGVEPKALAKQFCSVGWSGVARAWPAADQWTFWAQHLDVLEALLAGSTSTAWDHDPAGPFRAAATLPHLRSSTLELLFGLALGPSKTARPHAQALLHTLPGTPDRVLAALSSGKAETRAIAAEWLGRVGHEAAVPALEQAYAEEKQDGVRSAVLDALAALGRPVELYLRRDALAAEAERASGRAVPAAIGWFPFDGLPAVRWADDGEPVPAAVLRWFLVQAARQKSPAPNALLRKYCALFEPQGREEFGRFVLESWLREDVRPITPDEARRQADTQALAWHRAGLNQPGTVAEMTALLLEHLLSHPAGSAIASKGLLAVVAGCGAAEVVPVVDRYLNHWYGMRVAQCRALVAMLAWVEHRTATQLVLAVGGRFRTRSIQEEARTQAELLAERNGWTVDELADRTVPSAGFDAGGELQLDYGPRAFTAVLGADLTIGLRGPDGSPVKALPAPRQGDDEDLVKVAKRALSACRKELKAITTLQRRRLYEAMCTGRGWTYADWHDYLLRHPVLRQLGQRLVWLAESPDGPATAFRPLDDGTLCDEADDEVAPPPDALVRVAHELLIGPDASARWREHLADYAVKPLFTQFGRGGGPLPELAPDGERLAEVEGHLVEAFALRGRAGKLGWVRGPTEDGGVFVTYTKDFASLGLQAQLEFTGNQLPEENRTVALRGLDIVALGPDGWNAVRRPLREVPPVLLAECRQDVRAMAADGSGFDPDWERMTQL